MRVLQVTTDTNYGGVQEVVLSICRHASPGFEHSVLRMGSGKLEGEFRRYATLLDAGPGFEESVVPAIRSTGADILHVHMPGGTCPPWLVAAANTGIPIVESIHCVFRALAREEEICAARIVASEHASGLQRSRDRLHVIPHPISAQGLSEAILPERRARCRQERIWREFTRVAQTRGWNVHGSRPAGEDAAYSESSRQLRSPAALA